MFRTACRILASVLLLTAPVMADQITLKNGDRLTGIIVKSDGKTLTINSELAGTVNVPLDAVTFLSSEKPLYLILKDGQTLIGKVGTSDGKITVSAGEAGSIPVGKETIQTVRSAEEQAKYQAEIDRLRNPGLRDLWSGVLDTGISLSQGNADTTTFNFGVNAARTSTRDKISVHMTAIYAKNSTAGISLVTANAKRGGARYDINLAPKVFAFGLGDLENDKFQKLDLRLNLGGGMGWHARKNDRTAFDLFGGGSLNREYYSTGFNRSSGEVVIGQEMIHALSKRISFREKSVFYPNLSETGEYRLNLDASAVTLLNTWLGWTITFSNRYVSNPLAGTKSNDLLLSTGLRMKFGK
jgi:hypothetical protein